MKTAELDKVFRVLDGNPPCFAASPLRQKALLELDKLLSEADSEISRELGNCYRKRVDKSLDEMEAYRGSTPRLWKLYSSGFLIRSSKRTIAVDVNGGCTPPSGRTRLLLPPSRMRKIAELADEYYNTHSHEDHISAPLCDELAKRGKLMVMPREAIRRWIIPGAVPSEEFARPDRSVFMNWQGDKDGGLPCAMYLFTLSNGKNVFVRGDIYHDEGFLSCVEHVKKQGKKADYAFITPYYKGKIVPMEKLFRSFHCRFIPIHEWEFSHRPFHRQGPATQCFQELFGAFARPYKANCAQFLAWGESILLD